jgi:uncharacterized protein
MQTAAAIPPVISAWQREALTPVPAQGRIATLDVLRGFALFGILTVNMLGFSWPVEMMMLRADFWDAPADVIADGAIQFLAEGKFYPLFAFLFGLGAALQMERAESLGAKFTGRFCRRLLVLLGFGLAHALLLWEGDILVWYALCGFLLLPFRPRQPKTVLIWAFICLLLPALFILMIWVLLVGLSLIPEFAKSIQEALTQEPEAYTWQLEESIRIFAQGSYAEIFAERFSNLLYMWMVGLFYVPTFFAMFLVGLYVGKRRLLQNFVANAGRIRQVLLWGLIIGVPANLFYAAGMAITDMTDARFVWLLCHAVMIVGGPALSLAYAAAVVLLLQSEFWQRGLHCIATTGRMALSNYLLQSLICTTIFYSYGLGLFGSVGRATGLGLAILIYVVQVGISVWWLQRFQFGPMEWLWRTLTYGKRQPMRRPI